MKIAISLEKIIVTICMIVVIATTVVWVSLHTETCTTKCADNCNFKKIVKKVFWLGVGGQGRLGHQKHSFFSWPNWVYCPNKFWTIISR